MPFDPDELYKELLEESPIDQETYVKDDKKPKDSVAFLLRKAGISSVELGKKVLDNFNAGFVQKPLINNDLLSGLSHMVGRDILPAGLGMAGGAAGFAAGGPLGAAGGTAVGFGAGRAAQKGISQAINIAEPGFAPQESPGSALQDVLSMSALGAAGEMGGQLAAPIVKGIFGSAAKATPRLFRQAFGVEEPVTEYVKQRGAREILTRKNREIDTSIDALEKIQNALKSQKDVAGKAVGTSEESIVKVGREVFFDTRGIASNLKSSMKEQGFIGPASKLAQKSEVKELNEIVSKLDEGIVSANDLIKIKGFLDEKVSFVPGKLKPTGPKADRLIKKANEEIRGALKNHFPELETAYDNFKNAADIYKKYRKFFGGQSGEESSILMADADAIGRVRRVMKQGGVPQKALNQFDDEVAQGQHLLRNLQDTIAAQEFSKSSPAQLSPSNILMRLLAAGGLSGPRMGGALLKAGELAGSAAKSSVPLARLLSLYTALSSQEKLKQKK